MLTKQFALMLISNAVDKYNVASVVNIFALLCIRQYSLIFQECFQYRAASCTKLQGLNWIKLNNKVGLKLSLVLEFCNMSCVSPSNAKENRSLNFMLSVLLFL